MWQKSYYNVRQVLSSLEKKVLQNVTGITNVTRSYYKVWQIPIMINVTKWDVAYVLSGELETPKQKGLHSDIDIPQASNKDALIIF